MDRERRIEALSAESLEHHLGHIAAWWLDNSFDDHNGGFVGEISYRGKRIEEAGKSLVLNSRLLWFFSELAIFDPQPGYRDAADRAFDYLRVNFDDPRYGGAFWQLSADGDVLDDKKQTYALCFCIYGYSTYYALTGIPEARRLAREYFDIIEARALDRRRGGYLEAFTREWRTLEDMRLGEDDLNAPKTMNTHLHLLEAYTALHRVAPDERSALALRSIIEVFCNNVVDVTDGHLRLFFDIDWNDLSRTRSFGHDIEASWLLWEAALVLDDDEVIETVREAVLRLATTCLRTGIGKHGQLCDELVIATGNRCDNSTWWVQAEALVGFLNAHNMSGDGSFLSAAEAIWEHIQRRHIDEHHGEWHWMVRATGKPDPGYYKAGFWKGPYHNGRAMIEGARLARGPGDA